MAVGKYARMLQSIPRNQNMNNGTATGGAAHVLSEAIRGWLSGRDTMQQNEANEARTNLMNAYLGNQGTEAPGMKDGKLIPLSESVVSGQPDVARLRSELQRLRQLAKDNPYLADVTMQFGQAAIGAQEQESARRAAAERQAIEDQRWNQEFGLKRAQFAADQQRLSQPAEERFGEPREYIVNGQTVVGQVGDRGNFRPLQIGETPQQTYPVGGDFGGQQQSGGYQQQQAPAGVAFDPRQRYSSGNDVQGLWDAIVKAESGGNPNAVSPVGARGVMQLMPATAAEEAKRQGLPYSPEMLNDPEYNMRLGKGYFDRMLQRYDGNVLLAAAAYNAGMGNVDKWLKSIGDPRTGQISFQDFVGAMPFPETRNYLTNIVSGLYGEQPQSNAGYIRSPKLSQQFAGPAMAPRGAPMPTASPEPMPSETVSPGVGNGGGAATPVTPEQSQQRYATGGQPQTGVRLAPTATQLRQEQQMQRDERAEQRDIARATREEKAAAQKEEDARVAREKKDAVLGTMIGRMDDADAILADDSNWTGGLAGSLSANIPGTAANRLSYQIDAIRNQFTGENLGMMSGVLSDSDLKILGGLAGSLHIGMPREELQRTLRDIRTITTAGRGGSIGAQPSAGAGVEPGRPAPGVGVEPGRPAAGAGTEPGRPAPGNGIEPGRPAAPVRVRTPEEARALKPGTTFVTPDGRVKVR